MNRIANLLFLVMMGVITIAATQNHRPRRASMAKLAMRAFAARHQSEARFIQIGNQLADFARHRLEFNTT